MTTEQRRSEILKLLRASDLPMTAKKLASVFGVSRQVIVQDMAVIRASTPGITATKLGYVIQKDNACLREFKVRHDREETEAELNLIVDCGGRVKNVSISHRVYGRISGEMNISSRQDVSEFISSLENSSSSFLCETTSGYHYHLVEAASPERLDLIEKRLAQEGFLAPLQPWEREENNSDNE